MIGQNIYRTAFHQANNFFLKKVNFYLIVL